MPEGLLSPVREGVRVPIRLTPQAKADRTVSVAAEAEGGRVVNANVTARAQDGRANVAPLQLLASSCRVPRRDLTIAAGAASRQKRGHISGDPRLLLDQHGVLIAARPGP